MELVTGHQATPHITAEQVSRLLQGVTTMDDTTVYRLPIGNNCAVSVSSLDVSIDTGEIVLHGFHTTFEEGYTVTLDPTIDAAKSRIDKIVMEIIEDLTTGIQTANIEVVQGEESSSPVAPATPVAPTSPTEKFLAVGVIATVTVSNITIASSVDNTELYAGSYISEEIFGKTVRNQSSDQYNTTKAYKVGDYVIHNDTLYKCITACSAGSWEANQNCFVTDTLTNAVTTLNSDLTTLEWHTSSDGFIWTKMPNGFIYAYKKVSLSSGSSKGTLYPNSYYGTGNFSITDIPFTRTRELLAKGDVLGSYMENLKLDCACSWDMKSVIWVLYTDNPNTAWNTRIVVIGF